MSLTQQSSSTGEKPASGPAPAELDPYSSDQEAPVAPAPPGFQPWDSDADSGQQEGRQSSTSTLVTLWLAPVAVVLAGIGEYLLFADASRGTGVALIVLGMLLGIAAFAGARPAPDFLPSAGKGQPWLRIAWGPTLTLRLTGVAVAVCLSAGSIMAYLRDPGAIFGLQGVLWLASMAVLLVSCARWYPTKDEGRKTTDDGRPTTDDRPVERAGIRHSAFGIRHSEPLVFAGLIALSLVTHLAFLDQIPWRLHFDEGFAYIEVMRYYRGPAIPLFTTTWANTGLPSLWFGIEGLLMHITGPSLAGVRLGVALAGALTVIPVYGIGKLLAGRMEATLAAFAVVVSAVYVHYSRISIINVTTPLAWAICFYFLLKGLRSRRPGDFVWAGLAGGLSMYTYYGTRLLPFLLAIFVAYLLVFHFRAARERLGHFALLAIGFVAGFGPLIGYFILNRGVWAGRGLSQLSITSGIPTTWDTIVADWNILAPLLWRDFLGLSVIPSLDGVYWAPFLLPLEAALVIMGAGILVWRWRHPASFLVLLWGLGVMLAGGLLVAAPSIPNFAHWIPAFPAFYLAMALPLALWWNALVKLPGRSARLAIYPLAGAALIALLAAMDLGANAYGYLVNYPPLVPADHSLEAAEGRYVESVPPDTHVRTVGNSWVWSQLNAPIDEMMASPGSNLSKFFNPSREMPIPREQGRNLAFLFYNDMWDFVPVFQGYYPGGTTGEVRSPDGNLIAESYLVPARAAANRFGVLATFGSAGASYPPQWSGQVDTVGALPGGVSLSYPLTATWTGAFYMADFAPVVLTVQGANNVHLWVQGEPATPGTPLNVQPGWVRFSLGARLDRPGAVRLLLQQGGAPAAEIDQAHLWPTPLDQGLAVTLQGSTTEHRIDPFVGAGHWQPPRGNDPGSDPEALPLVAAGPSSTRARWEGELNTTDGTYTMEIRSDAAFQLTIDGMPVIKRCVAPLGNQAGDGQIQLTAGWHRVQIDYQVGGPTNRLEWFWVRPDGGREVVPPLALRIGPDINSTTAVAWPVLPPPAPCR
jgi:hypothetical protein